MSYTALYRKLRPSNFEEIIGQEHIVKTLKNQINSNRISHAYLFCGTRGTGKTSTAKVFAKAINCLNLIDGEPCNTCTSCLYEINNNNTDILEIDAASNNGVDDIREIREEVNFAPSHSRYKVYIIDEVHMLSINACNALLKTLEEPPGHVVFILATTDPQKLPPTILSRCQRFDFKRITKETMSITLLKYMNTEKEKITTDAINYICELSDGAMRDALSILDQALSFYFDEEITLDKIVDLIGSVNKSTFINFTKLLNSNNSLECIELISRLLEDGKDLLQFTDDYIDFLRDLLIIKTSQKNKFYLDDYYNELMSINIDVNIIIEYINIFSQAIAELKISKSKRLTLEIICIKICNLSEENTLAGIIKKIENLEKAPKIIQPMQIIK
ncbi:MAG: DNA polymerase III subunit gamma/tau [Lachnospirales bacterium]